MVTRDFLIWIETFDLAMLIREPGCETAEALMKASQAKNLTLHMRGDVGDTYISLKVSSTLSQSQAENLFKKLNALKYETIQNDMQKNTDTGANIALTNASDLVEGVILAR